MRQLLWYFKSVPTFASKSTTQNMKIYQLGLFLSLLTLSSCTFIVGEGPLVEREFELQAFDGFELDGSFDVVVSQKPTQQVTVTALDGSGNINLGTFVNLYDLKLQLDGSGDIQTVEESVLEVANDLDVIVDGSGDVKVTVKAQQLDVELEGSGDVDISGTSDHLNATLNGSGDIACYQLEATTANVLLDGSGNINVFATRKLKANLSGSGDIRYKGEPQVEASIDGSGSVRSK